MNTIQPPSKEPRYNLNYVLQETGIKADTLRAWERRYGLPQPERTEGGHRLFSDFDIETIKWLMARQEEGLSISRAVDLWRERLEAGDDRLPRITEAARYQLRLQLEDDELESLSSLRNLWVRSCLNFDEPTAEQVLSQAFAQFSQETVCVEILQAGLAEIGSRWYQGRASVQQEHFASELAVRRLHALMTAVPQPGRSKTILVGCPKGENHSFPALLISLLLRFRSWNVVYLGANVPEAKMEETVERAKPDLVVMIAMQLVTAANLMDTALYLQGLNIPLAFGGRVFTSFPNLSKRIPGFYLGGGIPEGIAKIEALLKGPLPQIKFEETPDGFAEVRDHFLDRVQEIEKEALKSLEVIHGEHVPLVYLQEANTYLAEDVVAALNLGDLTLLGSNIDWIEGLLKSRGLPGNMLPYYLRVYLEAAKNNLETLAQPVLDWLESLVQA